MKRERRQPTRAELQRATSQRTVVRQYTQLVGRHVSDRKSAGGGGSR